MEQRGPEDETELKLYFTSPASTGATAELAGRISGQLARLPGVADADFAASDRRNGIAEAAVIVSGVVVLVKSTADLLAGIRKIVEEAKKLARELGFSDVEIPVNQERRSVFELTQSDLEWLARHERR